jgi:di/tricarboxylate transporter
MTWEGWFVIGIVLVVFYMLSRTAAPPDFVLMGATVLTGLAGIITPDDVFSGFVNEGVLTIAALFVVASAMRETGALDSFGTRLLGTARTDTQLLSRLAIPVAGISAFLNNTPVLAMLLPLVDSFCRKFQVSPSRVLLPLSYVCILGGTCTLIGTSTNLVINGAIADERVRLGTNDAAFDSLGIFEMAPVGLVMLVVGLIYLFVVGRRLLPDRKDLLEQLGASSREYLINMRVEPECRLVDQAVEEAGLRHLPGLFLVEIVRGDVATAPVRPDEIIRSGDVLTFTGVVSNIVDLERIPGLVPVSDEGYEQAAIARRSTQLTEAVISNTSPLIGRTIRDAQFRTRYNAAVMAVHRGATRLTGRVGDIVLRNGDTLLLQTSHDFSRAHRNNSDFFLVSGVEESRPVRDEKIILSTVLVVLLVALMATQIISTPMAAFTVAGLMVITRCISSGQARRSVDWRTLITLAAALGLGRAMTESGAAETIATVLVDASIGFGALAVLGIVYVLTAMLSEMITNKAAAVLMFPIAIASATQIGPDVNIRTFAMAVMFAAATSLVTPLGFQTNLMVYGPGGYKYTDYIKVGLPLSVLLFAVAMIAIPMVWPL